MEKIGKNNNYITLEDQNNHNNEVIGIDDKSNDKPLNVDDDKLIGIDLCDFADYDEFNSDPNNRSALEVKNNLDCHPTNSDDDSNDEPTKENEIDDEAGNKGRLHDHGLASSVRLMIAYDDDVQVNEFISNPTNKSEDAKHKQLNTTVTNDERQSIDRSVVTKKRRRKKQFRMECLALITYSLNLNPSIRKQISMEMSSLTTDRELHIKSIRSADKEAISTSRALVDQSVMPHENASKKQRMEGMTTFTNVLSSRKVQLKKDVVMQGSTYNILKKNH